MALTLFCWHQEGIPLTVLRLAMRCLDASLYSLNFNHGPSNKIWFFIPPMYADAFEELCEKRFGRGACDNFLRHKEHLVNPRVLRANNIPFYAVVQR